MAGTVHGSSSVCDQRQDGRKGRKHIFDQAPSMTGDVGDGKGGKTVSSIAASWGELRTADVVSGR